jgi:MarR family transcriptional regulator for hemolysin
LLCIFWKEGTVITSKRNSARSDRETAQMRLVTSLAVLARAYRAAANQAVAHVGLSQSMAWPLIMIGRQGDGLRPGTLADLLAIEGPSLGRSLDQLVQAGFVKRRDDPVDRRAKTLHLTPSGIEACGHIEAALKQMRDGLFEGIADEDVAAGLRVFAVLSDRLGCVAVQFPPARTDADSGTTTP